jgi:hypothetical protein
MKLKEMFSVAWWKKYVGFQFTRYDYSGSDGRRVTDWMLHLGFFAITKHRIAR